jgi:hypothetical protein
VQFSRVLHTGGSTTDHDHMHQSVHLLIRLVLERSSFNTWLSQLIIQKPKMQPTIKQLCPDLVCIAQFFQETRVISYTLDSKGLILAANSID